MTSRRKLFGLLGGVPAAAAIAAATPATDADKMLAQQLANSAPKFPELHEWHIELLDLDMIPAMCDTPWCKSHAYQSREVFSETFAARWLIGDRSTHACRYLCDDCKDEFVRHPVRIPEQANPYIMPRRYVRVTEERLASMLARAGKAIIDFNGMRTWMPDYCGRSWIVPADDPTLHAILTPPDWEYRRTAMEAAYSRGRTSHATNFKDVFLDTER